MNKEERIIESSIEVFLEKGIEKATVSEIVKKAEIAQGTFYLYFDSKLSVMPKIAEVMVEKMLEELSQNVDGETIEEEIQSVIDTIFNITKEYKSLTTLIYSGLTQTQYVGDWEKIYAPLYDFIEQLLIPRKNNGEIRETVNTAFISKILIGSIESLAEQMYLYDEASEENVNDYKEELFTFILNGLK
uniref:TetR family transcriptional regulator n=1 Tax=Nosocomiicoccus ampullae TaxID=489910 RepID=UPI000834ABC9|nr:TetR family transcriptional regulator [Nosocomiicoccus ampullae]